MWLLVTSFDPKRKNKILTFFSSYWKACFSKLLPANKEGGGKY
jgi:hypothetical protein